VFSRITLCVLALCCAATIGCSGGSTDLSHPATPSPIVPQTRNVSAGSSSASEAYQALAFYPSSITIDAGDTITWTAKPAEPHTIAFPIPGTSPLPPTDPSASLPQGGTTYDGTTYDSSGFIGGGATYSLTFTKPGTYTYYSLPQLPLVSGTVVVAPAGSAYPTSQAQYNALAASAIASDFAAAQTAVTGLSLPTNTIAAGVSPATMGSTATVMRFLGGPMETDDLQTTIKVGTTLTFKNMSNNVPHTVTFPALGGTVPAGPPFQAAQGGNTYDGTKIVNSGPIAPGGTFSLTFTATGTFPYHCLFHDDAEGMIGSVIVTN
jgi:plastocyanin